MIKMAKSHVPVAAGTNAGMSGKNNEDKFLVSAYQISEENNARVLCAVLCDGVGGHMAGEVASEIGVNTITQVIAESNGQQIPALLKKAVQKASEDILLHAKLNIVEDQGRSGMGSTASVALLVGNRLYTATLGDSRIYLLRGAEIHQLSKDHTWIQDALEIGLITPEQVQGHPNNHVIRRYLGSNNPPEVDERMYLSGDEEDAAAEANQGTRLKAGDSILMCSDGLSDLVNEHEIHEIVTAQGENLQVAVDQLIDLANARGGHDNTTIIIFSVPAHIGMPPGEATNTPSPENAGKTKKLGCLPFALLPIFLTIFTLFMLG